MAETPYRARNSKISLEGVGKYCAYLERSLTDPSEFVGNSMVLKLRTTGKI
jgi:hypothetical protein